MDGAVPEDVAEAAHREQRGADREQVGAHDPLEPVDGDAELRAEGGQGHVDDVAVERGHERPDRHCREDDPGRGGAAQDDGGGGGAGRGHPAPQLAAGGKTVGCSASTTLRSRGKARW